MEHIVVYKTSQLWELNTVKEALEGAGISHYVQTEDIGGVKTALSVTPAATFGQRWLILVPFNLSDKAKEVILSLPVTVDSYDKSFIDFTKYKTLAWKVLIFIILSLIVLFCVIIFLQNK
jgi:hypothetical protein